MCNCALCQYSLSLIVHIPHISTPSTTPKYIWNSWNNLISIPPKLTEFSIYEPDYINQPEKCFLLHVSSSVRIIVISVQSFPSCFRIPFTCFLSYYDVAAGIYIGITAGMDNQNNYPENLSSLLNAGNKKILAALPFHQHFLTLIIRWSVQQIFYLYQLKHHLHEWLKQVGHST